MHTAIRVVFAAAGVLLLCDYSSAQDAAFTRKGATSAIAKRDSGQCWKLARKARMTEEQANQNLLTGYLVGGIIGVVIASSANEEANKDPKSAFRRQVHDQCMARRGYQKAQ